MIALTGTTEILELITTVAANLDYIVSFVDTTTTAHTPGSNQGTISTAATTTIVSAPAASTYRGIKLLSIVNRGTVNQVVTLQKDVGGTNYILFGPVQLGPKERLGFSAESGFQVFDALGRVKTTTLNTVPTDAAGVSLAFQKSGSVADTIGYWYCTSKDVGNPGAWAPGTPGLNGRVTDGTTTADRGCIPFTNPPAGQYKYFTRVDWMFSSSHLNLFFDVLWVNSGLVVTTTTAQAITSPTWPARDIDGTTNGKGLMIGLLWVAASTNAAVISNATVNYTNSDGTNGRTATLVAATGFNIPVSPVIGTIVWFQLQAGDEGVRSIEGVTLGTSLVTGTVSLIVARPIASITGSSNVPVSWITDPAGIGIRLFNGSCILHCYQCSVTTATNFAGTVSIVSR